MLFEGIFSLTLLLLVTVLAAKFILELANMPVLSDYEWEVQHGTRSLTDEEMLSKFKEHQVNLIGFDPTKPEESDGMRQGHE